MIKRVKFTHLLIVALSLLLPSNSLAQRTEHDSQITRLPDGTYKNDCSKYIYVFKQRPIFIGGKARLEKLLLQNLKAVALSQEKKTGVLANASIRLFADGRIKLIKMDCDIHKQRGKIKRSIKRIFLDRKSWVFPIFTGKQERSVKISIFISIDYKNISYDTRSAVDICEAGILFGQIIIN